MKPHTAASHPAPAGKNSATVHLDLDGAGHIFRVHGWTYRSAGDPLFESGMRNALDFFERFRVGATIFVIAEDLENTAKREWIQEAVRRGHQMGSHTITHRNLTTLSREEKRREIFDSRERIASKLGVQVPGFRAPGFHVDRESLELVAEAGYAYDSSLYPTADGARRAGIAHVEAGPHPLFPDRPMRELPLPAYAPLPFPFHPSYSLVLGTWYFRAGLACHRRNAAPLVLLFHLTDFSDPLPAAELPSWQARIFTVSHLSAETKRRRCARMLEAVQRDYRFVDTAQFLAIRSAGGAETSTIATPV